MKNNDNEDFRGELQNKGGVKSQPDYLYFSIMYLLKCWAFGLTGFIIVVLIGNFWLFTIFFPIYLLFILNMKELKIMRSIIEKGE